MFDRIRSTFPECLDKIKTVKGDVTIDGLGLSENDANEIAEKVSMIFHCAANVRFDQPLKDAVNMNTQGTFRVLTLADRIKNLDVRNTLHFKYFLDY